MIITKEIFEQVLEIVSNCCPSDYLKQLDRATEYESMCDEEGYNEECNCSECWMTALRGINNEDIIFKRGE